MSSSISLFSFLLVLSSAHRMAAEHKSLHGAQIAKRAARSPRRSSAVPITLALLPSMSVAAASPVPYASCVAARLHMPLTPMLPALREGPWHRSSSADRSEGMSHGTSRHATLSEGRSHGTTSSARDGAMALLSSTMHPHLMLPSPSSNPCHLTGEVQFPAPSSNLCVHHPRDRNGADDVNRGRPVPSILRDGADPESRGIFPLG
jgi:hypothetical protein